jgi:hypothetical protein
MSAHSHDFNPESGSPPPAGPISDEPFSGDIPENFSPENDQPEAAASETPVSDWRDPNLRPPSLPVVEAVAKSEAPVLLPEEQVALDDPSSLPLGAIINEALTSDPDVSDEESLSEIRSEEEEAGERQSEFRTADATTEPATLGSIFAHP